MKFEIIYEFAPKSFQIYTLLFPILIIVVGIISFRYVRQHGFTRLPLTPPNPFTQEYMNKIAEFFTFLFMLVGLIGLVVVILQMSEQLRNEKEFNNSHIPMTIEVTVPDSISVYDNIRLKEDLIINGQEYIFAKTENIKGFDWPQDLKNGILSKTRLLRISYINIDRQNIILKIEKDY